MADYSRFPFRAYSIAEVAQMFTDSVEVGDDEFAAACREELKSRPELVTIARKLEGGIMKGNNQIIMCQAEMIRAMEYYLNEVQFRERVVVAGITEDKSKMVFIVSMEESAADGE